MNSIQSRLVSGLIISLIVIFFGLWFIVSSNIQNLSESYIASRLEHDIETLVTASSFDENNKLVVNDKYINSIYKRPFSGHYYIIQHGENTFRSRSLWDQSLTPPAELSGVYKQSYQAGPENQSLILISARFKKQDNDINISIAEDLSPTTKAIKQFKNQFTAVALSILLCLLLLQFIILRKGLKPLRTIHKELHELEQGNINELSTNVVDELEPLVEQVNHLSSSLHKRLKRSRAALSDLSHAIKKPLTILQQFNEQQTALDNESKNILNTQIQSIQQLTDRILKRARVAGNAKQNKAFNLNDDLQLLIKTISTMYPTKKINIKTQLNDNLLINIDREDMLELLGNLLDNAWKWARHEIIVSAQQTDTLHISIEDDGTAKNAESLNELINRGVRLDETVSGYGFGLAISSDIVTDYEGTLVFGYSETLGGFKVDIDIPVKG